MFNPVPNATYLLDNRSIGVDSAAVSKKLGVKFVSQRVLRTVEPVANSTPILSLLLAPVRYYTVTD